MAAPASDTYRTIAAPAQGIYKEKGSKFIGLAYPVTTEEEIKAIYGQLKKEYFDARHHCYAFMLGAGGLRYRANDDGEPNHSAGDPILGQTLSLAFDYGQMNAVMSVVKDYKLEVKEQDFALSCCLVVAVRRNLADQVLEMLAGISTATPL